MLVILGFECAFSSWADGATASVAAAAGAASREPCLWRGDPFGLDCFDCWVERRALDFKRRSKSASSESRSPASAAPPITKVRLASYLPLRTGSALRGSVGACGAVNTGAGAGGDGRVGRTGAGSCVRGDARGLTTTIGSGVSMAATTMSRTRASRSARSRLARSIRLVTRSFGRYSDSDEGGACFQCTRCISCTSS